MKMQFPVQITVLFLSIIFSTCFFSVAYADDNTSQNNILSAKVFPHIPELPEAPNLLDHLSNIGSMLEKPAAQTGAVLRGVTSDFSRDIVRPISQFPKQAIIAVSIPLRRTADVVVVSINFFSSGANSVIGAIGNTALKVIGQTPRVEDRAAVSSSGGWMNNIGSFFSNIFSNTTPTDTPSSKVTNSPAAIKNTPVYQSEEKPAVADKVFVAGTNTSLILKTIALLTNRIDALEGRSQTVINNTYISQQTESLGDSISRLIQANNTNITNNVTNVTGGSSVDQSNIAITGGTITGVNATTTNLEVSGTLSFGGLFGSSGQVLTSTGTTTSPIWQTISASQWTTSGSNIYFNTGNVGIGTTTLGSTFTVAGTSSFTATSTFLGNILLGTTTPATGNRPKLFVESDAGGNVGIIVQASPAQFDSLQQWRTADGVARTYVAASGEFFTDQTVHMMGPSGNLEFSDSIINSTRPTLYFNYTNNTNDIDFQQGKVVFKGSGNVGIGTTTPGSPLTIVGGTSLNGHLTFGTDNTYDIGANGVTRPRNAYFGGEVKSNTMNTIAVYYGSSANAVIWGQGEGILTLWNNSGNDFNRLQFGGTTSAFPSLKRNGTGIDFRLADDSGYATTTAQGGIFNGNVGIGTTTPGSTLTVSGNAYITGTLNADATSTLATTSATSLNVSGTSLFQGDVYADVSSGRQYLKDFYAQISKATQSVPLATSTVIAFIGDSWTASNQFANPIGDALQQQYGFGGAGYIGAQTSFLASPVGLTVNTAGTWSEPHDYIYGPSISYVSSTDTATPARKTFTGRATNVAIHYVKQSGGGSFSYAIYTNGSQEGATTTVSTSNGSTAAGLVNVSVTAGQHTVVLTVTAAGSSGVILAGVDFQYSYNNGTPGVRVENLGYAGTTAASWVSPNASLWQSSLANLNPNLVVITLAVNEEANNISPATYAANLLTLINRVTAAVPNASIMLMTPADINNIYTNPMSAYVTQAANVAAASHVAFLNNYKLIGDYTSQGARGLTAGDGLHLNASGYNIIANNFLGFISQSLPVSSNSLVSQKEVASLSINSSGFSALTSGSGNIAIGLNALKFVTTGSSNTAEGAYSLYLNTTGSNNVAQGYQALYNNTTGADNVAQGVNALVNNTIGYQNTAQGSNALINNTTGAQNSAQGYQALQGNTIGVINTAQGYQALFTNSTASNNTAQGFQALYLNNADSNTAMGVNALHFNSSGTSNTAQGLNSLYLNSTGSNNTADGIQALNTNSSGSANAGFGGQALYYNTTGSNNVALGYGAGSLQANGINTLDTTSNSVYIGVNSRGFNNSDSNSIVIGYNAVGLGANTAVFGNDSITTTALKGSVGIGTTTPATTLQVTGTAGTNPFRVSSSTNASMFEITQAGSVGIGISSPLVPLHIVTTTAAGSGIATFRNDSTAHDLTIMDWSSSGIAIRTGGGDNMHFITNGSSTPSMTILSTNGYIGIGTTTPSKQFVTTGTVQFTGVGAGTLSTDAVGNVTGSSDERLKDIQGEFTRGLEDIKKINPISYHWKEETGFDTANLYSGFSAQNVQLAIPEAVLTNSNGFLTLQDRPLIAAAINAIKQLGSVFNKIEEGVAYMKTVVVEKFTVGSPEKPAGITIYDQATGSPYCIKVVNGMMVNVPGTCDTAGTPAPIAPVVETLTVPGPEETTITTDIPVGEPEVPAETPAEVVSSPDPEPVIDPAPVVDSTPSNPPADTSPVI